MLETKRNSIPKNPERTSAEDYGFLREKGLEYITSLGKKWWTDFNVHDPGITQMELLCYAITDLGYRTTFDVKDILTASGAAGPQKNNAFFTAKEILTSHPVTISDYRKLIIDRVKGVRNVWIQTLDNEAYNPKIYFDAEKLQVTGLNPKGNLVPLQLKGLYRIQVELYDYAIIKEFHPDFLKELTQYRTKQHSKTSKVIATKELDATVKNYICALLKQHRNLCEDVADIQILKPEKVGMCADIQLHPDADVAKVYLTIYRKLFNYISPYIRLYSLSEIQARGKSADEIFQGPIANRGFVDYDELEKFNKRTTLYASDIVSIIMDIEGVKSVKDLHLNSYTETAAGEFVSLGDAEKFCLHLQDEANASFRLALDYAESDKEKMLNKFNFYKDFIRINPEIEEGISVKQVLQIIEPDIQVMNDLEFPTGSHRETGKYYSVQNDFPSNYLLGQAGVPDNSTTRRKAQRMQLKGYLLFFEQLMADYVTQLDQIKSLFSWDVAANDKTYHFKSLLATFFDTTNTLEIKDVDALIKTYTQSPSVNYARILETESKRNDRRNRFLDHLLARFNEQFIDYSMVRFMQNQEGDFFGNYQATEVIENKIDFIKEYPKISGYRSHAIDYTSSTGAASNISGLEFRIYKALGINCDRFRNLVTIQYDDGDDPLIIDGKWQICDTRFDSELVPNSFEAHFGLHVLEHILLRPLPQTGAVYEDGLLNFYDKGGITDAQCVLSDPYSMKLTVVLPGWFPIAADMDFRAFTEQKIRMEAPAHAGVKICWINPVQMYEYEQAYLEFMKVFAKVTSCTVTVTPATKTAYKKRLKALCDCLTGLKNMYPPSVLEECDDLTFDKEGNLISRPVILGHSTLGGGEDLNYEFVGCIKKKIIGN